MASITSESNGRRTIQFVGTDGKRRSIRLGRMSLRTAQGIKGFVESLIASAIGKQPVEQKTAQWAADLNDTMHEKLAAVGLVKARGSMSLGGFIDQFIASRVDLKAGTVEILRQGQRSLVECFGADKPLRELNEGDADAFRLHLVKDGLSESTIRRRCGMAKQFFRAAVRKGLMTTNPFSELVAASSANASRFHFITREVAAQVLAACPDAQWRLLFALSRYGGLRCPSEHLALKWGDIDWEKSRIRVRSPKTEHHEGGGSRVIPMFPELKPYLLEVFDAAEDGEEYVITRYRHARVNLRTQLERIIRRAGLESWPKLWQNLRSTRETELAGEHPLHAVVKWMGNSEPVAAKHYLQLTDEHFAKAIGAKSVQYQVQQSPITGDKGLQTEKGENEELASLQLANADCSLLQENQASPHGFEP